MRYLALACDYDGTLAAHGSVAPAVVAALDRLKASGRKLVLVTGRELPDLLSVFPRVQLFDRVVAENGALLFNPSTREETALAEPPSPRFVQDLKARGVDPVFTGRVIVATHEPHQAAVLEAIRQEGLELQVIFNKGAVMVLPAGINKATGLTAALRELALSPHNVVGVGDAENDHAFLRLSECAVAVQTALPALKEESDLVTAGGEGEGVIELVERLIRDDLRDLDERLARHHLTLGKTLEGKEFRIPPHGTSVLLLGASGSGKSTLATAFLEQLAEKRYQFCVLDPEGDHETNQDAVVLGTAERPPDLEEVLQVLRSPRENAVVNLVGLPLGDRPGFFSKLMHRLEELRGRTGRPHWVIVDEAHHLLPRKWGPAPPWLRRGQGGMLFITVEARAIAGPVLESVDAFLVLGESPAAALLEAAPAARRPLRQAPVKLERDEALFWSRRGGETPVRIRFTSCRAERRRHRRKYAEGELSPDRSFYFRGPEGKLNLRAQNLSVFLQLAEGVDAETWLFHLRRGHYSRWLRDQIKDEGLAGEAARIESAPGISAGDSLRELKEAIERRYTLPA